MNMSPNMASKTCGMCGDYDGSPDNDLRDSYWGVTDDVDVMGKSWNADVSGDKSRGYDFMSLYFGSDQRLLITE